MTDPESKFSDVEEMIDALLGFAADTKRALADGRIAVDEVVGAVSDGELKQSIRKALEGLYNIPNQLGEIGPWDALKLGQRVISGLADLLTTSSEVRG